MNPECNILGFVGYPNTWCLTDGYQLTYCMPFIYFFLFFFSFTFISWRLITLQHCSGFFHTLTWISHGFTCIPHPDPPSSLPLYLIPLGLPSAPGPSTHLFLISCASVRSIPFLSFIVPIFAWNIPLVSLIFLKRSLVFLHISYTSPPPDILIIHLGSYLETNKRLLKILQNICTILFYIFSHDYKMIVS